MRHLLLFDIDYSLSLTNIKDISVTPIAKVRDKVSRNLKYQSATALLMMKPFLFAAK